MGADFDVVVVGAGPAGSAAALSLARKGVRVALLEKAREPGEKNMSGCILYGDFPGEWGLSRLVPDFESSAPLERRIISHEVLVLDRPDFGKGKGRYYRLSKTSAAARVGIFGVDFSTGHDFSVLRRPFDGWLASAAVKAGATLLAATTAQGLLFEKGSVAGVRTPREEIKSKLVIDASGVASTLVEEAGLRGKLAPRQLYHGIKRLYRLEPEKIDRRFRVRPGEGRALFFLGDFMHGIGGGAFVITNRETLSVGVVVSLDSLLRATTERFDEVGRLVDVQNELERHPVVAELLEGAHLLESSAHNTPKGYKSILKKPYADGFLVAGDALGAFVKVGPVVDGMRRAISSGMMAARAYLDASASGSYAGRNLSRYRDLLTPVYEDVNRSGRDGFLSESSFAYNTLPRLLLRTRLTSSAYSFRPSQPRTEVSERKAEEWSELVDVDPDDAHPHVKVNAGLASKSVTKPWIPTCPTGCFALRTSRGEFSSFKDLFEMNLAETKSAAQPKGSRGKALFETREDIASGKLEFDRTKCVSCGTCGSMGPHDMVMFTHEKDGFGVRYRFG